MIHQHQLIRGTIALAAALTASLAPAAWADPAPLANAETTIAANNQSSTAVRPNPDEQTEQAPGALPPILRRAQASELAALHHSQAREADALSYSVPTARYSTAELNGSAKAVHPVAVSAPKVGTPSDGFDWGDAGIGAGGMLAVTLLGFGGAVTLTHRRRIHDQQAS